MSLRLYTDISACLPALFILLLVGAWWGEQEKYSWGWLLITRTFPFDSIARFGIHAKPNQSPDAAALCKSWLLCDSLLAIWVRSSCCFGVHMHVIYPSVRGYYSYCLIPCTHFELFCGLRFLEAIVGSCVAVGSCSWIWCWLLRLLSSLRVLFIFLFCRPSTEWASGDLSHLH